MTRPRQKEPPTASMIRNFRLLDLLPEMDPDEQLEVFERVLRSPRPQVRERALGVGAAILSDRRLLEFLRQEDDDVRRSAAVEMLKLRRMRSINLACYLLDDRDPDVVLQAIQVLAHLRERTAIDPLIKALHHESPNVVQEAVLALGRIGDHRALPAIAKLLEEGESWVEAAAIEALGRLGGAEAVPPLARLLPEPTLGPLAADALARIGGSAALEALAEYWLTHRQELDREGTLARLAELLEGLSRPPEGLEHLERELRDRASDERKGIRIAAVRCLVALRGKNRGLWMF